MKKTFRPILATLAVALLLSSCVIEQNYHFKNDFTGSYQLRFDLSSMAGMSGEDMGTDTIFTEESLAEMSQGYAEVEGITNVRSTYENNVLFTGFDFNGVKSLNEAMTRSAENNESSTGIYTFTQKGKTLKMKLNRSGLGDMSSDDAASMAEMVSFKLKLTFDKKIKKVKGDAATWNKGDNEVTLEFPMKDFLDEKKNLDVEIRLK